MPTDPLDDRIRSMLSDAMSSTPAAPTLSLREPVRAAPGRRGLLWAGVGIAACVAAVAALVWTSGDDDHTIVSATTTTPVTEPSAPWPEGVAVLVASSRGIERVSNEDGHAAVSRVLDGVPVARAIELEDGSIVYQEVGGDIRSIDAQGTVSGTALVTDDGTGSTLLEDADKPNGELRIVYRIPGTDPAAALQLGVWFQPNEPRYTSVPGGFGVGYRRFTIVSDREVVAATVDDTGQGGVYAWALDGGAHTHTVDSPIAMAGDGAGSIAFVNADGKVSTDGVRSGIIALLDDPAAVGDIDRRADWLAVTRFDGSMLLVDTVTGSEYDVPVSEGSVTLSRRSSPSTQPVPTTVAKTPVSSVVPSTVLPEGWPPMVTAGADGVWEYGPDGAVQWTTEPMAFAVKAPDGSMLMQRQSGGYPGAGWSMADTLPLVQWAPGAPPVDLLDALFPAADVVAGWYTLHDAARVDGEQLVLLDRQAAEQTGIDTPPGALLVVDLDRGSLTTIDEIGGWESSTSRLHLAETGLVVGETYSEAVRSFYSVRVDGTPALTSADLGLEPNYYDCVDCPRLYTISRDGATLAWLDGTRIERRSMFGDDFGMPPLDVGAPAGGPLDASDLSINADVAVYDRSFTSTASTPVVVYIDGTSTRSVELGPAARTALP